MKRNFPNSDDWYSLKETRQVLGVSTRTMIRRVRTLSDSVTRSAPPNGPGRPEKLFHYTAFPELRAHHERKMTGEDDPQGETSTPGAPISREQLAIAELRLTAVKEFEDRCRYMSKELAAAETVRAWQRREPSKCVMVQQRLPGGHVRKQRKGVTLPSFKPRTLRGWASSYIREGRQLLALVPETGSRGRRRVEIPAELLSFVYALYTSSARGDVTKAVALAEDKWPGDFPEISLKTWQRRLREFDPRKAGKDLNHSVSQFRQKHSPDIEIDWDQLEYNGRWEIDDFQEDWYAHGTDLAKTLRPYAYGIIRTRTRQWIAITTSETPVVQEQVQALVAVAMASSQGGLPKQIKFERGTVAADAHFERLLESIGVQVSRTSMDGGKVHAQALPDRATGHFQGKGVVERAIRGQHDLHWNMRCQVGTEERHSAPARTETLRREAERRAKDGKFLILPKPEEWHRLIANAIERHNNKPNGGLPEIICPTGERRHMTPNEMAIHLKDEEVRVLDERMLPLFYSKGVEVKVTRNGFRIHGRTYGRFDDELKALERVTVYAHPTCPDVAFVEQLGRCVEGYEKAAPGDSSQFEKKRGQEKRMRNKHEAMVAQAIESGASCLIDAIHVTQNPVPDRAQQSVTNELLLDRAQGLQRGIDRKKERQKSLDSRFDLDDPAPKTRPRRGLLARSQELTDQGAALNTQHNPKEEEEEKWNL